MTGFNTNNLYPPPPPPSGGWLRWAFIGVAAAIAAPLLMKACAPDKPLPQPEVTSTPEPEVEPERVPHFYAVATSLGSWGVADSGSRDDVQIKALELCEAHRNAREKKFAYVSAEPCKVRGVASNFGGGACITLSTNDTEYDYEPHVVQGPEDLLESQLRSYLTSEEGKYYNTRYNPQAKTFMYCVDYYGKISNSDVGYEFSRPKL